MALFTNNAEMSTNGTTVTTANSGTGGNTAWGATSIGAGSTLTYSNTQKAHGGLSLKYTTLSGQMTYVDTATLATLNVSARMYLWFPANPPSTNFILQIRHSGGSAARMVLGIDGKLFMQNSAGVTQWTATTATPTSTWVRIDMGVTVATSTTGLIRLAYYLGDSTVPIESFTQTGANCGTANVVVIRYGKGQTSTWADTFYIDDTAYNDSSSNLIGAAQSQNYYAVMA